MGSKKGADKVEDKRPDDLDVIETEMPNAWRVKASQLPTQTRLGSLANVLRGIQISKPEGGLHVKNEAHATEIKAFVDTVKSGSIVKTGKPQSERTAWFELSAGKDSVELRLPSTWKTATDNFFLADLVVSASSMGVTVVWTEGRPGVSEPTLNNLSAQDLEFFKAFALERDLATSTHLEMPIKGKKGKVSDHVAGRNAARVVKLKVLARHAPFSFTEFTREYDHEYVSTTRATTRSAAKDTILNERVRSGVTSVQKDANAVSGMIYDLECLKRSFFGSRNKLREQVDLTDVKPTFAEIKRRTLPPKEEEWVPTKNAKHPPRGWKPKSIPQTAPAVASIFSLRPAEHALAREEVKDYLPQSWESLQGNWTAYKPSWDLEKEYQDKYDELVKAIKTTNTTEREAVARIRRRIKSRAETLPGESRPDKQKNLESRIERPGAKGFLTHSWWPDNHPLAAWSEDRTWPPQLKKVAEDKTETVILSSEYSVSDTIKREKPELYASAVRVERAKSAFLANSDNYYEGCPKWT